MEKILDYGKLYKMQDRILNIMFALDHHFYLTGGTALHRFYYNLRYSDDLDFFSENDPNFKEHINIFLQELLENKILFTNQVNTRDFSRIMIEEYLQIDFVNDRVYREGVSKLFGQMRIDNLPNILSNKIGAIIDRDEEKDFFDLFAIAFNEDFNWSNILEIAGKKSSFNKDHLLYRIETFPLDWLDKIKIIKPMQILNNDISALVKDLRAEQRNSLCR
ncbi:MAG: nucleotidyl transferase AbiEii/AbiGii toxin family protein [Spirochaetia bacterium]|jgi:predicted nucleotidyltransferase component of viral defense system|nr:nucleotidyl transferase AbiEii/AbiGii toxin family protein [Spirochaetia bacterium]